MIIPGWKAILNNGEVFEGGNIASWRQLKEKCGDKLKITALLFENEEVDLHAAAESYFVMYDKTTSLVSGGERIRMCLGSFRKNGKARLNWKVISSNLDIDQGAHIQIVDPINVLWRELAIPIDRGNNYEEVFELHTK